jgi:hypothetical protein
MRELRESVIQLSLDSIAPVSDNAHRYAGAPESSRAEDWNDVAGTGPSASTRGLEAQSQVQVSRTLRQVHPTTTVEHDHSHTTRTGAFTNSHVDLREKSGGIAHQQIVRGGAAPMDAVGSALECGEENDGNDANMLDEDEELLAMQHSTWDEMGADAELEEMMV